MNRDSPRHTVILDWDGTMVPAEWPGQPTKFMPGAVEACHALSRAGVRLTVHSARMNPYDPWSGKLLPQGEVARQKAYIRYTLDSQGLTYIDIWDKPGKPSGSAYVDDKGFRYSGTRGAWRAMTNTLLLHLKVEAPTFPATPGSDTLEAP